MVDRVEVIRWTNVDRDEASQFRDGVQWELQQRGFDYNMHPSDMSPFDPRRDSVWTEVYDFEMRRGRARETSIVGYWSVGYLGASNYVLLWAWALLP
jgi:hypothetical protein